MNDEESEFHSVITNTILTDYFKEVLNYNNVTLSEFRGFVYFGENKYISVLNYSSTFTAIPDFILFDGFKKYIVSKRLS